MCCQKEEFRIQFQLTGLWRNTWLVRTNSILRAGLLLLGLHSIPSGGRVSHPKIRDQKSVRLCSASYRFVQFMHSNSCRNSLWFGDCLEIYSRFCFGKFLFFFELVPAKWRYCERLSTLLLQANSYTVEDLLGIS